MRNVIFTLFSAFILLNGVKASAQILTSFSNKDSAFGYYTGGNSLEVHNHIKSGSSNPVYLKWNVVGHNLGTVPGWNMLDAGFCDNVTCYSVLPATLTNNIFTNGTVNKTFAYTSAAFDDFHMLFSVNNPAVGTSGWVRILARDTVSNTSRTLTFIGYKAAAGVTTTINSSDDVVLYPIPAHDAVNVIFDDKAGVKTIAVYNLIGKLTGPVYKPSDNGSARIDLNDMPNGIYFLRLINAQGQVIATRRFTRQ